ncbi:hypothetical protein [Haloarcula regularis]|uniref:hypothetical protein n=1 Tax=Haloarcula regularis TaxID=3033392 RepID=UPI0023E85D5F|nr:hypothetical protein [Halomicroarcula sp. SYNS111]
MISYGNIEEGADEPDPAYMHHCREFELRNDNTAGDGLNGSIRLEKKDLKAVGAKPGDPVKVYAEADGRWILYERDTYTDRAGVGMPKGHREKLGLNSSNRTVELWLDEAESEPDETSDEDEKTGKQVSLTGEETKEREYVLIPNDSPIKYHHVSSKDSKTECGIDFGEQEHRRFSDPGDALDQCSDCAIRSSDDMTNKELVNWLGEQAGFEAKEGTPAYLSKGQLVALRDYVLELQEELADESADENKAPA